MFHQDVAIVTVNGGNMKYPACFIFSGYTDAEAHKARMKKVCPDALIELRVLPLNPDSKKRWWHILTKWRKRQLQRNVRKVVNTIKVATISERKPTP